MPRQRREVDPINIQNLINYIHDFIRMQRREKPRYTQSQLARDSKLQPSVLSELMNHPDREPAGRTLARLSDGLGLDPTDVFHLAYPSKPGSTKTPPDPDDKVAQRRAARIKKRAEILGAVNPRYAEASALLEKLPPDKQGRVLGFIEGLIEKD